MLLTNSIVLVILCLSPLISSKMPPKKAAKKNNNGYKMPEPIKAGEVLQDISKKKWVIGPSIGKGGFGEIYSARDASSTSNEYKNVVKIEPHANGPLFVEMHFYMRFGKPELVEGFRNKHSLKTFGMPLYYGSGSHEYNNEKYRFLVMDKFGKDLWKIFEEHNKKFSVDTVFKLAIQILYVLQYIHENDYVHADIKAANLLFGTSKETANQIYLVDFGLATKYSKENEFKPNPKKAHDGTIEYLSRDAHKGVQTMRGDLEILAYNMIQWLGCKLPWENVLNNPEAVHQSKTKSMDDIPKFMKQCFGSEKPPDALVKFLEYVNSLKHNSVPDYKKLRNMFIAEVKNAGGDVNAPFNLSQGSTSRKSIGKRKSTARLSLAVKVPKLVPPVVKPRKRVGAKTKPKTEGTENVSPEASEPEKVKPKTRVVKKAAAKTIKAAASVLNGDALDGFTPEMRAIMEKRLQRNKAKKPVARRSINGLNMVNSPEGYNEEMKTLHKKILKKKQILIKKKSEESPQAASSPGVLNSSPNDSNVSRRRRK